MWVGVGVEGGRKDGWEHEQSFCLFASEGDFADADPLRIPDTRNGQASEGSLLPVPSTFTIRHRYSYETRHRRRHA